MSSTKFVFFGLIGKTRWPPLPLIGWDIFDFSSKTAEGIQRNLIGSKISTFSTKFVFFGPIWKTRWLPWPIPQKGCTLYSGTRYVALWASCFIETFLSTRKSKNRIAHLYPAYFVGGNEWQTDDPITRCHLWTFYARAYQRCHSHRMRACPKLLLWGALLVW